MQLYNIAIVDGNEKFTVTLEKYLKNFFDGVCDSADGDISYKTDCFGNGINFLSSPFRDYDIVLMDMDMLNGSNANVASEFRKVNGRACIIFFSSSSEAAIKGYEYNAVGFIVKSSGYAPFEAAMERAVKQISLNMRNFVMTTSNRFLKRIPVQSILYAEVQLHRLVYHTFSGDVEVWDSMSSAESQLSKHGFVRCNSGYLVNLRYVDEINGDRVIVGGNSLIISRQRRTYFKNSYANYLVGKSAL